MPSSVVPSSTVEDYLKAILLAEQERPEQRVATGRLAKSLGLSPGTVTAMVKTLAEADLVTYEAYGGVQLTATGRQLAGHVLRRHRLIELFLVQILGLDWSEVHPEAERLEHAVSERVIDRIDEMLGRPTVDPHGDPIPDREGLVEEPRLASLLTCPLATSLVVARIADQDPEFLQLIDQRRLRPGSRLAVERRNLAADTVEIALAAGGGELLLGYRAASKIFVREAVKPAAGAARRG